MMKTLSYSIIAAEFNRSLVDRMVEVATEEMKERKLPLYRIIRIPGAFEIPIVAALELDDPKVGGLVILGHIERGETLHGEVMGHVVHQALVQLQIQHKKPMGLGIIGPGATPEQALVRQEPSARAAVNALHSVLKILQPGTYQ